MVWLDRSGDVLTRSAAAARVARYLGGGWSAAGALLRIVPRGLADRAYDFLARHRHGLAGAPTCVVPPASLRHRFLE